MLISFAVLVLLFVVIWLIVKIRKLEARVVDVSPSDLYPFIEELRDLVLESERVAEKLDSSIREREDVLEDLADLTEKRLRSIGEANMEREGTKSLKEKILELAEEGEDDKAIAKELGISTTEVKIVRSMAK
ncbi:hypothetical protein [Limisalsivibrio acetivorans]|uniref:hypothetical protein n=1 Tax=Limisalsivibrio acetivorans TaxID=1304888 RepID=UPI0003B795DC|nr:hypothetical protein [Limisalsivibrio acetivorans]